MGRVDDSISSDRLREGLRSIFGEGAEEIIATAAARSQLKPVAPALAPRDAGKFLRQFAAIYCDSSAKGDEARLLVASILKDAMRLVNLIAEANPER